MARTLVVIALFLGLAGTASAQVFKPRDSGSTTTTTPAKKTVTKKSTHHAVHHTSHASSHASSHKIAARRKSHHKKVDPNYVKITDDPEDE